MTTTSSPASSAPDSAVTMCVCHAHSPGEAEEGITVNGQRAVFYPKAPLRIPSSLCETQTWALCSAAPPLPGTEPSTDNKICLLLPHLESYEWISLEKWKPDKKKIKERREPHERECNLTNMYWVPFRGQALLGARVTTVNGIWISLPSRGSQDIRRHTCARIMTIQCDED